MTSQSLEARVAHVEGIVGQMDTRLTGIETRLTHLEQKMDARFAQVDDRFAQLDKKIDDRFEALRQEMLGRLDRMEAKFERLFLWMVGLVVGTVATAGASIVVAIVVKG